MGFRNYCLVLQVHIAQLGMGNYNHTVQITDYDFSMPLDTNVIYTSSADPSKFHIGETIEIIPVVALILVRDS